MSRTAQGPYLRKRPPRYKEGKLFNRSVWVIRDGKSEITTGCPANSSQRKAPDEAQQALSKYIADQYKPIENNKTQDIEQIDIADVLMINLDDKVTPGKAEEDKTPKDRHIEQTIDRLNDYWGSMKLSEINKATGKGYVKERVKNGGGEGGARRDLEILRAAVNHHGSDNLHYGVVNVWMPDKGEARERWLERDEAARMLWEAYRYREVQTIHVGPRKGEKVVTDRRTLRHVARFMLIGFYTGTRSGAIASASIRRAPGKSWVDLEHGIYYRQAIAKKKTKKRQPPAPIPERLLAHLRRWVRVGIAKEHFVEWNGNPVLSVKKAFRHVVELAELDLSYGNVTPHTLRHTAATWLMQQGVDIWTASGFLGMTPETLEKNYAHHSPTHLADAVKGITSRTKLRKAAA